MRRDMMLIESLKARSQSISPDPGRFIRRTAEWRELLLDIIYANTRSNQDQGLVIYLLPGRIHDSRDEVGPIGGGQDFFNSLGHRARALFCQALEIIIGECLHEPTPDNQEVLSGTLQVEWFLEGSIRGQTLLRIIASRQVKDDLRSRAANALVRASFPNAVPLSFWRDIDLGADPVLLVPVMTALKESDRLRDMFAALKQVKADPGVHRLVIIDLFTSVLVDLLRALNGVQVMADELLPGLPLWSKELIRELVAVTPMSKRDQTKLVKALE